ncbi:hypothetical protein [Streptomyces sp. NPDC006638]|uniref:hypothetical protein n=1 Tax=Streptomyces sp. NPDC006638 TaxID=3157183 RepID=UPI0033A37453
MMIGMEAEVMAGLIGFGGAAVGAGGALLGAWLQQRHQAETAQKQREDARASLVEERGRTAAEKALAELYGMRRHAVTWKGGMPAEERNKWSHTGSALVDEAELNAALIPGADELRARLQDALATIHTSIHVDAYESEHEAYLSTTDTEHAIALLSAYMRGDALPSPTRREERVGLERDMREEAWRAGERSQSNPS